MKNLISALLLLTLFGTKSLFAQQYAVSGTVEAAAFPGKLHAAVTDAQGQAVADTAFSQPAFRIALPSPGIYAVVLKVEGYADVTRRISVTAGKPVAALGKIPLQTAVAMQDIVVTGGQAYISNSAGGFVYNVLADPDSKKLKMKEFFGKIPGIWVDPTKESMVYEDNRTYLILIDGKRHMMINSSKQYAMSLIQADYMKTIEVMDPAPPEWEGAADVVIDIRLAKELPNGIVGSLSSDISTQGRYGGFTDLTYKYFDLILNLNYALLGSDSPQLTNTLDRETSPEGVTRNYHSENTSYDYNQSHALALGASYDIDKKNSLSLSLSTKKSDASSWLLGSVENRLEATLLDGYRTRNNTRTATIPKLGGAFTYLRNIEGGRITLSYGLSNEATEVDYLSRQEYYSPDETVLTPLSTDNTSSRAHDANLMFTKTLAKKHNVTGSARYTNRRYDNLSLRESWDPDAQSYATLPDGLDYTQQVGGVQAAYSYRAGKLSLNAEVRGEYVSNQGRFTALQTTPLDYSEFNLLPRVTLNYMQKNTNRLFLSFVKRAMRPNLGYLNPFVDDSDPQNIVVGAPGLRSEQSYMLQGMYTAQLFRKKLRITPMVIAQYIDRAVERYKFVDENNVSTTTYRNLGHRMNYQARVSVIYSLNEKIRIGDSFIYRWNRFYSPGMPTRMNGGFLNNFDITVMPWKGGSLSGNIFVQAQPKEAQESKVSANASYNFNYAQTLLKNKLFLYVWVVEPFRDHSFVTTEMSGEGFRSTLVQERLGRSFSFGIRWTFGRLRDKVREAGTGISRDDLSRPTE